MYMGTYLYVIMYCAYVCAIYFFSKIFIPFPQLVPVYPGKQLHVYVLIPLVHAAPWRQGPLKQLLITFNSQQKLTLLNNKQSTNVVLSLLEYASLAKNRIRL